ncbi:unnamed protein product, partial [Iphiclides podalirius]
MRSWASRTLPHKNHNTNPTHQRQYPTHVESPIGITPRAIVYSTQRALTEKFLHKSSRGAIVVGQTNGFTAPMYFYRRLVGFLLRTFSCTRAPKGTKPFPFSRRLETIVANQYCRPESLERGLERSSVRCSALAYLSDVKGPELCLYPPPPPPPPADVPNHAVWFSAIEALEWNKVNRVTMSFSNEYG